MLDWDHRLGPWRDPDWLLQVGGWLVRRGLRRMTRAWPLPGRGSAGHGSGLTAVLMRIPPNPAQARTLVRRNLDSWPVVGTRLYVACPVAHPETLGAVAATGGDPRLRIVVIDAPGLPGRAACLDRLYAALEEDERRGRFRARVIVLDDAGDPPRSGSAA